MNKMHSARFTLQFDTDNPIHFNAISILNDKERNKANYIAELIWEKEFSKEQDKNASLKDLVKAALLEVLRENKFMFTAPSNKTGGGEDEEIILGEKKSTRDIANGLNKEVMQGLGAFGIKPK